MNFINTFQKRQFKLSIDDKQYSPLKLGKFFQLEELKRKFTKAVREKNKFAFKKNLLAIIELQTGENHPNPDFLNALRSFIEIVNNNTIEADAVFLRPPPVDETQKKQDKKYPRWHYDGRTLASWIDMFAKAYGWSLEQILDLDINTATYLYQEITVREQFEKEWEYSLTELAYAHDKESGKSRYIPLERPYWMQEHIDGNLPKTKLLKSMLPQGVIIDLGGMGIMGNNESVESVSEEKTN